MIPMGKQSWEAMISWLEPQQWLEGGELGSNAISVTSRLAQTTYFTYLLSVLVHICIVVSIKYMYMYTHTTLL